MPSFLSLPASMANRPLLVPGRNQYLFGGNSAITSPTLAILTNAALTSNVATVSLSLTAGNVPTTAQTITVQGCSDSNFNVVNAAITAVSGFNTGDNSTGTVSYAVTHANIASEAATAQYVVMPVAETTDVCANGASLQCAMPFNDPRIDQARTVVAEASFPSIPTTATLALQWSDDDSTYYDAGVVATVTAGVVSGGFLQVQNTAARFYRFNLTSVTGGSSPTIIAKMSA